MTGCSAVTVLDLPTGGPAGGELAGGGELVSPAMRRQRLGRELRRLREAAGLRLEDAATELGVAPSTLCRIEIGKAPARTSYVRVLLGRYGLTDDTAIEQLTDLAREGHRKGWWADYDQLLPADTGMHLGLESAASVSRTFAAQVIPGLLQTRDYAAAAWRARRPDLSPDACYLLADVTVRRRRFLRADHQLHAVIDESAFLRAVGSRRIMTAQLAQLHELATSSSCTVQILALSRPGILSASFSVLSFPDAADPDVACSTGPDGQLIVTRRHLALSAQRSRFDALAAAALPVGESASLLAEMVLAR